MMSLLFILVAMVSFVSPLTRSISRHLFTEKNLGSRMSHIVSTIFVACVSIFAFVVSSAVSDIWAEPSIISQLRSEASISQPRDYVRTLDCRLGGDGNVYASMAIQNLSREPLILGNGDLSIFLEAEYASTSTTRSKLASLINRSPAGVEPPMLVVTPGEITWLELRSSSQEAVKSYLALHKDTVYCSVESSGSIYSDDDDLRSIILPPLTAQP